MCPLSGARRGDGAHARGSSGARACTQSEVVAGMGRPGSCSGDRGGYLGGRSSSDECRRESFVFGFFAETGSAATEHTASSGAGTGRARCAKTDTRNTDTSAAGPRTVG
jgi:hypothetical protein